MSDEPKIIQIIPAVGWRVLYAEDDGNGYYVDLVCWALLDNENIEPVDTDSTGYVDYMCRETGNFVGVYGPSIVHTPEQTRQLVANWQKEQAEKKARKAKAGQSLL